MKTIRQRIQSSRDEWWFIYTKYVSTFFDGWMQHKRFFTAASTYTQAIFLPARFPALKLIDSTIKFQLNCLSSYIKRFVLSYTFKFITAKLMLVRWKFSLREFFSLLVRELVRDLRAPIGYPKKAQSQIGQKRPAAQFKTRRLERQRVLLSHRKEKDKS